MKLRRVAIENVRSFFERQELHVPGDLSIIIGPNGGGKTNLLDTAVLALRLFLLKSWVPRHNPTAEWQDRYDWAINDAMSPALLEKHTAGAGKSQVIELDIEVTTPDLANILRTKAEAADLQTKATKRYTSFPMSGAAEWATDGLEAGAVITYLIVDGNIQDHAAPSHGATFQRYLETYEISNRVREEFDQAPLSMPMISLPVNRASTDTAASISLANFNEYDYKRLVDAASSRGSGSIISLAIGRLASRFRGLLEHDDGKAKARFLEDAGIAAFTRTLRSLGYDWNLECTNAMKNQYDLRLQKEGSSFRIGAASSGERELLTYLFAIYALNVRDALIVVDEPELHLHPRWQRTLLSLFETLAKDTGNQFIMATHSPVFVSPASIQYVSRVYSDHQRSRIVRLGDSGLPEPKHLFGIVNSQNNERVFFADLVILVEGLSDRIFFEALLRHFQLDEGTGAVYEVVSVGGKMLFPQYEKLLAACNVPYVVIADLDYVRQVGSEPLKSLFTLSASGVSSVIADPGSIDGHNLVARLDDAVNTGNIADLQALWEYVKARQTKLRVDLTATERAVLDAFIREQRENNLVILNRGALESYLPLGYRGKDLEKLIRLVANPDFWALLPQDGKTELEAIVAVIRRAQTGQRAEPEPPSAAA